MRGWLVAVGLLAAVPQVAAVEPLCRLDDRASCGSSSFAAGEMVRFTVRWGLMPVGEGTARLRLAAAPSVALPALVDPWSHPRWFVEGRGVSVRLAAKIVPVDDRLRSWVHPRSFAPHHRELDIDHRREIVQRRETFDPEAGVVWFWRNRERYDRRRDKEGLTIRSPPLFWSAHDPVSLFLHLRCRGAGVGESFELVVHEYGKDLRVLVHVDRVEPLETIFGTTMALRASVRAFFLDEEKTRRPFRFWVSRDRHRIPLRFELDLPFADLHGQLAGYRRHETAAIVGALDPSFLDPAPSSERDLE
ncbi:MAG: DUF3108 domain-containing protein [Acidobacteriota bacterium]